jgi:hypothetical protein
MNPVIPIVIANEEENLMFTLLFLATLLGFVGGLIVVMLFHNFICEKSLWLEYKDALNKIRDNEGRVCAEYDTCHHRSCHSSYSAWAIADAALTGTSLGTAKVSGWWGCHSAASMRRDVAAATKNVLNAGTLAANGVITTAEFHDVINDARAMIGIGPLPKTDVESALIPRQVVYGPLAAPQNE